MKWIRSDQLVGTSTRGLPLVKAAQGSRWLVHSPKDTHIPFETLAYSLNNVGHGFLKCHRLGQDPGHSVLGCHPAFIPTAVGDIAHEGAKNIRLADAGR